MKEEGNRPNGPEFVSYGLRTGLRLTLKAESQEWTLVYATITTLEPSKQQLISGPIIFFMWLLFFMGLSLMDITNTKVMFGSPKILRKEKNVKENDFFMFGCPMKNIKENQIWLKLIKNLCIFKLFNLYIDELK